MISKYITSAILIVAMLSNLTASVFVIGIQLQNNAERRAASAQASKERKLMLCVLQTPIENRSDASVDKCRDQANQLKGAGYGN